MMLALGTIFCVGRRVPCGEAGRKAVCGKTALPKATAPIFDSTG